MADRIVWALLDWARNLFAIVWLYVASTSTPFVLL